MKLALDKDQLVRILEKAGFSVDQAARLPNNKGWQFRLSTGQIVNRFDTGTVNVQGADPALVCELLGLPVPKQAEIKPGTEPVRTEPPSGSFEQRIEGKIVDDDRPPWC